jgi:hypothetical protein
MVFWVLPDPFGIGIYYERREEMLNQFLKRYKALLPWINSNNVELKFLILEEFQKPSNFMINMLILNYYWFDIITTDEKLKRILNSLELTILSLENYKPIITDSSPEIFFGPSSICGGILEICSKFPRLQYLQVENFEFSTLDLKKTHFKNVIFNRMYFNARTCVGMPLCLEKFHMGLDLEVNDNPDNIEFSMNECKYIKEL